MIIKLGEYMPDLAPVDNPGLSVAKNCLPFANHYRSMPNISTYSLNGLANTAKGFFAGRDKAGNVYQYAGDASALYRLSTSTWYDSTRVSGAYNTAADDHWEFAQWGEQVVATNYTDDLQAITFGQSNFAAVSGSPPKARHLGIVRDFLVLGNVTDYSSGAAVPTRIHWSGFDNIAQWTPGVASTQCDYQDLKGNGGWVQRIVGGERGVIIQERSIQVMTYVGPPVIFQIDEIEPGKGTQAPNSVIVNGSRIFYLGQDDFYMFSGGQSLGIGHDRIYQTFIDSFDNTYPERVWGGTDPYKPFVFWAYPASGNVGGNPNRIIVYNWATNKWAGPIEITIETFCNMLTEGYTLDSLDSLSSSIDALAYTLDSRFYMGGTLNMGAFDSNHYLNTFGGSDLTAVFETGDKLLVPGKRMLVTNTRPLIEGGSASVSVAVSGRNKTTESASFSSVVSMNSEGECPVDSEGRYHRFRINVADGFTHASAIEIEAGIGGKY